MTVLCVGALGTLDRRDFRLPGTIDQWPPDRPADIRHIRLELEVDPEQRRLDGVASLWLTPTAEPLRRLSLDLVELAVKSVTAQGNPVHFLHEGGVLELSFDPPFPVAQELQLDVAYGGSPRTGLNFVGPDENRPELRWQAWSQGQDQYARYWFPCRDFPNQRSTTEVVVTAAKNYVTVSNGRLLSKEERGESIRWHWSQEVPHPSYLVSLVVAELETWQDLLDGVQLNYYVPPGRRADGERAFARTGEMIRVFTAHTGQPYPYPKYDQVVVADFSWGGMENTSATTLYEETLHDERAHLDYRAEPLVAHELAHQWFGDLITCREWAHAWLNESFATYMAYVVMVEATRFKDAWLDFVISQEASAKAQDQLPTTHPIVADIPDTDSVHLNFDSITYEKGASALKQLAAWVGEEAFFGGLQRYFREHAYGNTELADFLAPLGEASGRDLRSWSGVWLEAAGLMSSRHSQPMP